MKNGKRFRVRNIYHWIHFFAIIKLVITGTKAAYEAVFDPDAKDEKVRELIASCMLVVHQIMTEKYTKQPG